MNASLQTSRRGISLLEVLISIGILAIGLSAVVALVPAGKSEAGKAVILDRATALAMNTLNDAVTFGLTRPATFPSKDATFVVFDPLGSSNWPLPANSYVGSYKAKGIFASGPTDTNAVTLNYVLQGRDDLVYTAPTGDDDPPTNSFSSDGVRSFQGRTTSLLSVAAMPGGALQAGELAKVTAVVFHNRNLGDPAETIVSGSYGAGKITFLSGIPADRTLKTIVVPGTVIYDQAADPHRRWLQTAMASADESNVEGPAIYVTFVGDVEPAPGTVIIALDSVGLAERVVTLEGPGPYGY
jgi:type II secretory pathway pseudopilin PulG